MLQQLAETTPVAGPAEPAPTTRHAERDETEAPPKSGLAALLDGLKNRLTDKAPPETPVAPDRPLVSPVIYQDPEGPPPGESVAAWRPLIDPMKVIGGIVDSRRIIIATTILGAALGVMVALSTPKKYEAATELLVDPRDLKLSDRDLTQQGLPSDATLAIVENQTRILTSGTVLIAVVDKLRLDADPEFNGEARTFSISGTIGELRSILSRNGGVGDDVNYRRTVAVENLARSLTVERGGKTFVITVAVTTLDARKSALIANTMTDVFLKTYGNIQSQTAGRAADELTSRLDELRKGVEEAERKVAAFKAENDIIDPQGKLITDDELVGLNEQLTVARARTLELNAKAASVRGVDTDSVLGGAVPESLNSNIITELRSQYASLKSEADRLAVRLGPRHPQRQAVDAQLAGARTQIADELRRLAASVQVELKRAVELEQQLSSRLAQLKVRQGDLSGGLVQLRELEREASTKRAVYESYLLRARETGEQRDINTANMSVISVAYPPLDPSGPSRAMIALTGMMLGFGFGIGFGAMRGAYVALRDRRRESASTHSVTQVIDNPPEGPPGNGRPRAPHRPENRTSVPSGISPNTRTHAELGMVPSAHAAEPSKFAAQPLHPPFRQYQARSEDGEQESRDSRAIAEIRESLAEFREVIRDLSEQQRKKRRYF